MKKFLFLFAALAVLGACNDDPTDETAGAPDAPGVVATPAIRFEQPSVTDVESDAAMVECRVSEGAELLETSVVGFVYGAEAEDTGEVGDWLETTDCDVEDGLVMACIVDLLPGQTYRLRAFAEVNDGARIEGPECTFTTPGNGDNGDDDDPGKDPGGDDEDARLIVLDGEDAWPENSYNSATCHFDGYDFDMANVGDFGSGIQLKSGSGWIANKDDMGVIRRIELVYSGKTSAKNISLYLGDTPQPETNRQEAAEENGTYVFDCAAAGAYRYFKLLNGSGASYLVSIKIYCGGKGTTKPDPEKPGDGDDDDEALPVFATPSFSGVTQNSASVSCAYTYAGDKAVTAAWFVYKTATGAEQQAEAASAASPATAKLEGLSPATLYSFALCVEIGGQNYRSAWVSFMTRDETGNMTAPRYAGWPELPIEVANSDYYYASHICPDLQVGGHAARNYTVCFSAEHHCPLWVAAPRHKCYTGSAGRSDAYGKDPDIPSSLQYNSKSTGGGCNKGHILGSSERTYSSAVNRQVFYYTNIAPQYSSGFNTGGGGWNTLEDYIDGQVCADTTYLVIGTYFEPYTDGYGKSATPKKIEFGSRSDVSCPTMFYIAALRTKKGNTGKSVVNCSADELQCAVFVRTHTNELKGQKVTSREMMSVADIEQLTGFTFFANVPNAPKYNYDPADWGL